MNGYIELKNKEKYKDVFDVIVVGGGPSGSAAAISAARNGAKVLLIEQQNSLGGMWTSGFVNPLFDHENKKGLLAELISDLKKHNAWGGFWNQSFIYEYMKLLLEQKCIDADVTVLYDTKYTGVITDNHRIIGISVNNIEGNSAYKANIVIDASGDAAVAADAGAKWLLGGDCGAESCQSMTLMFLVAGIPEKYHDGLVIYDLAEDAFKRQGLGHHCAFKMPYLIPVPNSDFAVVQLTHMRGYSPLSARERTEAIMEGRRQMIDVFEALRDFDEDFKNLSLIQSAPLLGVRESRRIIGDYTISDEDVIKGAAFSDGVATATFGIDIHAANSDEQICQGVRPYQIPYRSMIPAGLEGLLVTGKTISGSHLAMASYRVTGNCCAMGEAAGKAAAFAALNQISLRDVPDQIVSER